MDFKPNEKLLLQCVLTIEGRQDSSDVRICSTEILDDVPVHTNNTSKVIRIRVAYEVAQGPTKMAALVLKVPFLRSQVVYEGGQSLHYFVKEARFYQSVIPQLQRLLEVPIAPTLFAVDDRQVLFLEDISARGYRVQVAGQLDAEHCAVIFRHLAHMHAASQVLYRDDSLPLDELFRRQFLHTAPTLRMMYVEVGPLLEALHRVDCLSEQTIRRFDLALEKACDDIADEGGRFNFNVLNHGDLKAHNILFEYDNRCQPVQCNFIDFQISHWSSPALDIIFFAILSMDRQVFASNFERLLVSYLSTLNCTLERLNCEARLTKAQLQSDLDEVKAHKIFGFLFRTMINIRETSQKFDYAKTEQPSTKILEKLVQSAEIRASVGFWLGEFEKSGVI